MADQTGSNGTGTQASVTANIWDARGVQHSITIGGLPAGQWYAGQYQVSRFQTAVVQLTGFTDTPQQVLRVVDLATGAVLGGLSLGAGENLLQSSSAGTVFHTGRYGAGANGTTLTVQSYGFGLDANDTSLATVLGSTSFNLPAGASTGAVLHTYLPPGNGAPGYLITYQWNPTAKPLKPWRRNSTRR